jgi:hypothetical protein
VKRFHLFFSEGGSLSGGDAKKKKRRTSIPLPSKVNRFHLFISEGEFAHPVRCKPSKEEDDDLCLP